MFRFLCTKGAKPTSSVLEKQRKEKEPKTMIEFSLSKTTNVNRHVLSKAKFGFTLEKKNGYFVCCFRKNKAMN